MAKTQDVVSPMAKFAQRDVDKLLSGMERAKAAHDTLKEAQEELRVFLQKFKIPRNEAGATLLMNTMSVMYDPAKDGFAINRAADGLTFAKASPARSFYYREIAPYLPKKRDNTKQKGKNQKASPVDKAIRAYKRIIKELHGAELRSFKAQIAAL